MLRPHMVLTALIAAMAMVPVAACTPKEPDTMVEEITRVVPEGADVVCAVARESLELATGWAAADSQGEPTLDGVPCVVVPEKTDVYDGPLTTVTVVATASDAGATELARINGDGFREPDFVYPDLEGAAWGDLHPDQGRMGQGAVSSVVTGDHVVTVSLSSTGVGRTPQVDLLALSRQVAGSLGLEAD